MWDIQAKPGSYVILGDDIVIFDKHTAVRYEAFMVQTLGVPISKDKSIISDNIAEFAGKVITSNRIISKYNWIPIRDTNVMDVLSYHGPTALQWVPESLLVPSVTVATLPKYLGGLGWTLPKEYVHLVREDLRDQLEQRQREEPLFHYMSVRARVMQAYTHVASLHPRPPEWSISRLEGIVDELEKSPSGHVTGIFPKYTTDVTLDGRPEYVKCSNPNHLSSSSLVRFVRRRL